MAKVIGIDPGSLSMDILGLDDDNMEIFYERVVPRVEVTRDPSIIINYLDEALSTAGGVDSIVAPSGYGVPLKRASRATYREILEATFIHDEDLARRLQIVGLRDLMNMLRESRLPVWFVPGVIHLPTVPPWRKANRIDLGTADKVFTVAAALRDEVELRGTEVAEADLIVVEAGYAYTAALSVRGGQIIDGVGGTSGYPGFLGGGFMDAEVCYSLATARPRFSKSLLFSGGAASIMGSRSLEDLESGLSKGDPRAQEALKMLSESILKDVSVLLVTNRKPKRIYLSGRVFRLRGVGERLIGDLEDLLRDLGVKSQVTTISSRGKKTKEGAYGAALIASGLAGGRYTWIIKALRLEESRGSIFDYIAIDKGLPGEIRNVFLRA